MQVTPVSLYFGLREGDNADLEVIAKAALEWSNSVRLAVSMIDPRASVRLQIVDAEEGSLRLNTVLDWAEEQLKKIEEGAKERPRLAKLAAALAVFLLLDAGPAADYWFGEPDKLELNEEDRAIFEGLLEKVSSSEELKKANRKFFQTIERDPAITSVGVSEGRDKPLVFSVPSDRFAERSGLWKVEDLSDERISEEVVDVVLRRAALENAPKKWKFELIDEGVEFSATMRDEAFLEKLENDEIGERLRFGIPMRLQVTVKERLTDDGWRRVESSWQVLNVISPS